MHTVKISQAQSTLSRSVDAIEQGRECEIVITRGGRPAAKLISLQTALAGKRLGGARDAFEVPDTIDAHNEEIAKGCGASEVLKSARGYFRRCIPNAWSTSQRAWSYSIGS